MKLRELLGIPGVHVFMLAHTLAGGYTPSSGTARETHRGWRMRTCVCCRVYACRCTGILGVLTLRLIVAELGRGMREEKESDIS